MDQFASHFPKNVGVFVDLFCGGATVGLSVNAKRIIFIDNNLNVINLLKHLSKYNFDTLLPRLEKLIKNTAYLILQNLATRGIVMELKNR